MNLMHLIASLPFVALCSTEKDMDTAISQKTRFVIIKGRTQHREPLLCAGSGKESVASLTLACVMRGDYGPVRLTQK